MRSVRSLIRACCYCAACAAPIAAAVATPVAAQGTIAGRITRSDRSTPIPGAIIRVVGTTLGSQSDSLGEFRITGVPVGRQTVEVRAYSFTLEQQTVIVRNDELTSTALVLAVGTRLVNEPRVLLNQLVEPLRDLPLFHGGCVSREAIAIYASPPSQVAR